MLVNQIKREQRMPQMIKHTQKQHDVELLPKLVHVIDREFSEFDIETERVSHEMGLGQISLVKINSKNAIGSAPLHLDTVKSAVATDIEYTFPSQVCRDRTLKSLPLHSWKIAKKMFGRGEDPINLDIVKPLAQ